MFIVIEMSIIQLRREFNDSQSVKIVGSEMTCNLKSVKIVSSESFSF